MPMLGLWFVRSVPIRQRPMRRQNVHSVPRSRVDPTRCERSGTKAWRAGFLPSSRPRSLVCSSGVRSSIPSVRDSTAEEPLALRLRVNRRPVVRSHGRSLSPAHEARTPWRPSREFLPLAFLLARRLVGLVALQCGLSRIRRTAAASAICPTRSGISAGAAWWVSAAAWRISAGPAGSRLSPAWLPTRARPAAATVPATGRLSRTRAAGAHARAAGTRARAAGTRAGSTCTGWHSWPPLPDSRVPGPGARQWRWWDGRLRHAYRSELCCGRYHPTRGIRQQRGSGHAERRRPRGG